MESLLGLPSEILIGIISYLDIADVLSCQRTCCILRNIIGDSIQLHYIMQLMISGMQDNPFCRLPIADRLVGLESREAAWRSLDWEFVTSIDVPSRWSGVYDLTPSVFLLGKSAFDFEYVTAGIQTIKLPTRMPGQSDAGSVEWIEFNFGMQIIDFGTAIEEHDLIVCVSSLRNEDDPDLCHIVAVLLRYSTKKMHDACKTPVIAICRAHISRGLPHVSIEVVGENLAIVVAFNVSTSLHIFDWKSGECKSDPIPVNNTGLTFLREDLLLNPNVVRKTLDIYHIPPSSLSSPASTTSTSVRLIQSFRLPAFKACHRITSVSCRSDPNPTSDNSFPKYTPTDRPFTNDPACAIIIFTFTIQFMTGINTGNFVMIVHRKALLDSLPPSSLQRMLPTATTTVTKTTSTTPWEDWGPPNTRWFNVDFPTMFITTTAGQRCVQFVPSIRHHGPVDEAADNERVPDTILILDFNPEHVVIARRFSSLYGGFTLVGKQPFVISKEGPEGVQDTANSEELRENVFLAHDVFEGEVVGRLPYLVYKADQKWNYDAVLIDEERILGIRSDSHETTSVDVIYIG